MVQFVSHSKHIRWWPVEQWRPTKLHPPCLLVLFPQSSHARQRPLEIEASESRRYV